MAKYKKINEGIIDKFIDKIFAKTAKKMHSKAIAKLSKQDPEFAKNYKTLQQLRAKIEKDMKNKGKDVSQTAAQIAKENINEVSAAVKSKYQKLLKKPLKYKDKDGNDKEITVGGAKRNKNHPAHKKAVTIAKTFLKTVKGKEAEKEKGKQAAKAKSKAATKKAKAEKEKEHDKERSRQDKATKDAMKDVGKDIDVISKFFTRPK